MITDWPEFVESHLTGIAIEDSRRFVRIYLRGVDHRRSVLTISGVDRLIVNEMRERNIVESIRCWNQFGSDMEGSELLTFLITGRQTDDGDTAFAAVVETARESIRRGEKVLLEISPVYGAQVIALATDVSIESE